MIGRYAACVLVAVGLAGCAAQSEVPRPFVLSAYPGGDIVIGMPEGASPIVAERMARFNCFAGPDSQVVLDRVERDRRIYRCIDIGKDEFFPS